MPAKRPLSPFHAQIAARHQAGQSADDLLDSLDYRELSALCDLPNSVGNALDTYLARNRSKHSLLAQGIVEGVIRSARGRIVATNLLCRIGRSLPDAPAVYAHLLDDRSDKVVDCALFALALLQTPECKQAIQQRVASASPDRRKLMENALAAIEARDYRLYAPGFVDSLKVW